MEQANEAHKKLTDSFTKISDSDAKIAKAEQVVTDLMEKLRVFKTNQDRREGPRRQAWGGRFGHAR